ncbi:MAG: U2 snRNP-associated SURP domain-containing protein [Paramarteilia canceri]
MMNKLVKYTNFKISFLFYFDWLSLLNLCKKKDDVFQNMKSHDDKNQLEDPELGQILHEYQTEHQQQRNSPNYESNIDGQPLKQLNPKLKRKKLTQSVEKKSNLQDFIEELDRESYLKQKQIEISQIISAKQRSEVSNEENIKPIKVETCEEEEYSHGTTNLYVGNLNRNTKESDLAKLFVQYGPIASVRLVVQDSSYAKVYGFVAFLFEQDSIRALEKLNGFTFNGSSLVVKWGKPLKQTNTAIYNYCDTEIARQLTPKTKHPFSAYEVKNVKDFKSVNPFIIEDKDGFSEPEWASDTSDSENNSNSSHSSSDESRISHEDEINETRAEKSLFSVVKVVVPRNKRRLFLINRTVQYVALGGPILEAIIMNREKDNPEYKFLFDFEFYEHIYYRWKLFSLLNNDKTDNWRVEPFIMYDEGSIFYPPLTRTLLYEKEKEKYDKKNSDPDSNPPKKHNKEYIVDEKEVNILPKSLENHLISCLLRLNLNRDNIGRLMMLLIRLPEIASTLHTILNSLEIENVRVLYFDHCQSCILNLKHENIFSNQICSVLIDIMSGHIVYNPNMLLEDIFSIKLYRNVAPKLNYDNLQSESSESDEDLDGVPLDEESSFSIGKATENAPNNLSESFSEEKSSFKKTNWTPVVEKIDKEEIVPCSIWEQDQSDEENTSGDSNSKSSFDSSDIDGE